MDKSIDYCVYLNSRKHVYPTEQERESLLAIGVLNGALALPTACLNAVIIIAIFNTSSLYTPSFLLLASLALTDFLMGLFGQSLHSAMVLYYRGGYLRTYCYLRSTSSFVVVTAGGASLMTVTAIAIDRYLAIRLKIRYKSIVTISKVKRILVLIWILAILLGSFPFYISTTPVAKFGALGVAVCVFITVICYFMSFRAVRKHCARIEKQTDNSATSNSTINIVKYKKLLKTMFILLVFIICCFSLMGITVWLISSQNQRRTVMWGLMSIVGLNSTFDPVVYISRMRNLQKACKSVLARILPFTRRNEINA